MGATVGVFPAKRAWPGRKCARPGFFLESFAEDGLSRNASGPGFTPESIWTAKDAKKLECKPLWRWISGQSEHGLAVTYAENGRLTGRLQLRQEKFGAQIAKDFFDESYFPAETPPDKISMSCFETLRDFFS